MLDKKYPNTFAPRVENKELSVDGIIRLLFMGLKFKDLPLEVQQAVREEMNRRHTKKYENTFLPIIKESLLSLEDINRNLVLHKIQPMDIPEDLRKVVDEEIRYRTGKSLQEWWDQHHAAKYEMVSRRTKTE